MSFFGTMSTPPPPFLFMQGKEPRLLPLSYALSTVCSFSASSTKGGVLLKPENWCMYSSLWRVMLRTQRLKLALPHLDVGGPRPSDHCQCRLFVKMSELSSPLSDQPCVLACEEPEMALHLSQSLLQHSEPGWKGSQ